MTVSQIISYVPHVIIAFLTLILLIIHQKAILMFQAIQDQITRLSQVLANLGVHITAITQERDALKAQVQQLQDQVAQLQSQAGDPAQVQAVADSLKTQVDAAAALFPAA